MSSHELKNALHDNKVEQIKPFLSTKSFPQFSENYGSIKEKKVHPDLAMERSACDFEQVELTKILYGEHHYQKHKTYQNIIRKTP